MRYLVIILCFPVLCVAGYAVVLYNCELFGEPPAPIRDTVMMLVGAGSLLMSLAIAKMHMALLQERRPTS